MTNFEASAREAAAQLEAMDLSYALVGGFAVSVWSEPRFTRDIDLVVAVADDTAAEAAVRGFVRSGYTVLATVEHENVGRLSTARLAAPDGDVLDLLFASSGIEAEVAAAAERVTVLPELVFPVAQVGHLIALKLLASDPRTRPQDAVDLRSLVGVAGPSDVAAAETAVELISQRGFARGRDLKAALGQLLADR